MTVGLLRSFNDSIGLRARELGETGSAEAG